MPGLPFSSSCDHQRWPRKIAICPLKEVTQLRTALAEGPSSFPPGSSLALLDHLAVLAGGVPVGALSGLGFRALGLLSHALVVPSQDIAWGLGGLGGKSWPSGPLLGIMNLFLYLSEP